MLVFLAFPKFQQPLSLFISVHSDGDSGFPARSESEASPDSWGLGWTLGFPAGDTFLGLHSQLPGTGLQGLIALAGLGLALDPRPLQAGDSMAALSHFQTFCSVVPTGQGLTSSQSHPLASELP